MPLSRNFHDEADFPFSAARPRASFSKPSTSTIIHQLDSVSTDTQLMLTLFLSLHLIYFQPQPGPVDNLVCEDCAEEHFEEWSPECLVDADLVGVSEC
jgi:hypothetical protein